jgi:hypothetical protein
MSWMNEIANVLQNYSKENPAAAPHEVDAHFSQVAQAAPASAVADGLAAMFRSNQTPPFAQMVSQLFSNSSGNQRASLLNALLANPAAAGMLSQLAKSAGINLPAAGPGGATVPAETAAQISPEMVQQAAAHAEQHDPSIIDRVSEIYAAHPTLVKTLGAAAMGLALSHLASRRN